jgi:hypothetical protein
MYLFHAVSGFSLGKVKAARGGAGGVSWAKATAAGTRRQIRSVRRIVRVTSTGIRIFFSF